MKNLKSDIIISIVNVDILLIINLLWNYKIMYLKPMWVVLSNYWWDKSIKINKLALYNNKWDFIKYCRIGTIMADNIALLKIPISLKWELVTEQISLDF